MTIYYVDTSIWRDLYEDRRDNLRPLGEFAFQFFKNVIENKDTILFSDVVQEELLNYFGMNKISEIIDIVQSKGLIVFIKINENEAKEAAKLCRNLKIPFGDAAHIVLAMDYSAILISRDKHIIEQDIVSAYKPEDL